MVVKLDDKARKILYQLDLNCRQSDKAIGRKVGLSKEVVRYRILKLQREGVIKRFYPIIDYIRLGYLPVRNFLKFRGVSPEKEAEIINYLKRENNTIRKVQGGWDLNTTLRVKNIYEYKDFFDRFLLRYSHHIEKYWLSVVSNVWFFHLDYLLGENDEPSSRPKPDKVGYVKGSHGHAKIDARDQAVLKVLMENSRMKNIDMARKINGTEMIVRYRMKKMMEAGVLVGFRPRLDLSTFGYTHFKIHMKLQNLTPERKQEIFNYVNHHPNIIYMMELVGGDDLEIDYHAKDNRELYKFLADFRSKFSELIKDYEFMEYVEEHPISYLPK